MNEITKKIAQYSALVLALAVLPMACKKDKEADDPNIIHRDLNLTLTSTASTTSPVDSIDINLDGIYDLGIALLNSATGSEDIVGQMHNSSIVFCDTVTVPGGLKFIHASDAGFTPPDFNTSTDWKNGGVLDVNFPAKTGGISGQGDKFISFAVKGGLNGFYGWLRVNLSSDRKTLLVKDVAYSALPNTPIKTGSK